MTTFLVLVPVVGSAAAKHIDARSGIVTTPEDLHRQGSTLVYFEGNRYGAANLMAFADRVRAAADRMAAQYPTVARGAFAWDDFVVVARYAADGGVDVQDAVTLTAWLAGHPARP